MKGFLYITKDSLASAFLGFLLACNNTCQLVLQSIKLNLNGLMFSGL